MAGQTVKNIFTGGVRIIGQSTDLVAPWCLELKRAKYVELKLMSLMQRILTDCYRFSTKISNEDKENSLWDSVVYKEAQYGLISWLSYLIANRKNEYLVYDSGIIRKALIDERKKIDEEYKIGKTENRTGVIVDFRNYAIGRLLRHYFNRMYTLEEANENSIALGGSLQFKVADLRKKIGVQESKSDAIRDAAGDVLKSASNGIPVVIDAQDSLEQTDSSKNVSVTDESKDQIYQEMAALLGCMPSYISGINEKTTGSGYSYERLDGRNEDCIKNFWISIFEPVIDALLGEKIKFVSQKWQQIKENLGSISMVEGLSSIPLDIKASIIAKLVGENEPNEKDPTEKKILETLNADEKRKEEERKNFLSGSSDEDEE
jgi:hypothetical protein